MDEQKYIEQIIVETGYQPTKKQLNYLNAMGEMSKQEILLNLRNAMTSYGEMQPLPELLKSYGANEQFIKTAQKEIAQWYWNNLGKIAEEGNKLTDFEMEHTFKFALDKLKELGLSDAEVNNAFMTDDHFKTGLALSDPDMRGEFDKFLKKNAGMSIFELEDSLNKAPDTAKGLNPEEDFNVAERAYEDRMADMAAREPSEAELNRYINSLNTADDAQIDAYNEMMASNTNDIDKPIVEEIKTKNNLPKGIKGLFKEYGIDYEEALLGSTMKAVGSVLESFGVKNAMKVAESGKNVLSKYELANFYAGLAEIAGKFMYQQQEAIGENLYKGVASIYGQKVDPELKSVDVVEIGKEAMEGVAKRSPSAQLVAQALKLGK